MDLKINIKTDGNCNNCKVIIQDNTNYLPETSTGIVTGEFKYSDTVSVDILQHNKLDELVIEKVIKTLHTGKDVEIPVTFDGWFTIIHMVIPSKEWFEREVIKEQGSEVALYNIVYYSDGDLLYKYQNGIISQVSIEELLEINPINTTISKTRKEYVSICYLQKCYLSLCQEIFNQRGFSSCWNKNTIDSELIYKRDLVWMAINVIKYLTECQQLFEVERILEQIKGCNGLCNFNNNKITSKISGGCGCSK